MRIRQLFHLALNNFVFCFFLIITDQSKIDYYYYYVVVDDDDNDDRQIDRQTPGLLQFSKWQKTTYFQNSFDIAPIDYILSYQHVDIKYYTRLDLKLFR